MTQVAVNSSTRKPRFCRLEAPYLATTEARAPKVPSGASRMTQPTILNTTCDIASMSLVIGALYSLVTLSAQPNSSDTSSADRIACPVIAPNRESGIILVTNSTKPIFSSESTPGILLASSSDTSMFMPAPGLKMLATTSPISIDTSESTRK